MKMMGFAGLNPSYELGDLPVGWFLDRAVESFFSDFPKNICSHLGRIMIVTDAGRGAVDAAAFCARWDCRAGWRKACERSNGELTNDVAAYGEVVWS